MMKNIILTGFMGTGKTTVGRLLAAELGYAFVDTDELIEARDGRSVAQIFRQDGETAFRRWEALVSQELAGQEGLVIATGGRLLLNKHNASLLTPRADVFCLTAAPDEIVSRLAEDGGIRPLLAGSDPASRIRVLLARRADQYGCYPQISTDDKTPREIVEEIIRCISVT